MGTQEQIVDRPPVDQLPVDPNVTVPKHVREAAAAADAIHAQAYQQPTPEPEPEPAPEPSPGVTATVNPEPQPQPPLDPHANFVDAATPQDLKDSIWAGRYNSMRGRYEAMGREVGQLRTLVDQLGAELQATQAALAHGNQAPQPPQSGHHHEQLITAKDRETFGEDLIDVAARAAKQAVAPELDALRGENAELKRRVVSTGQQELRDMLSRAVPNWPAINKSREFQRWLSLRNAYTGEVRGIMLNAAYKAADAPKVIQLFRDYVNEVNATGAEIPGQRTEQQQLDPQVVQPQPAPRTPAIQLDTLAAPGRARPAPGDGQVPAEKPTYTRAHISSFYRDVRRGAYAGREVDKNRIEADIIAAQSEGRVL